ncbi:MAG: F0F1 ATP synthase subunit gamma [Steroidobacteraceae bacterium]
MSDSLASLRRHLNGARQLGSVVRAMKAISASSISQYEKAVAALGQYQRAVELGLSLCLGVERPAARAPAIAREYPTGALIFGSDQGLVGRFNEIIGDFACAALGKLPGPKTVWAVGERLTPALEAAGLKITKLFPVPSSVAAITALVTRIQIEIEEYSAGGRHGEIHVFHNSPQVAASYVAVSQRLLPLDADWYARLRGISWPNHRYAQVLDSGPASLAALVHEQLFISLYRACAESLASENVSRLEAMQRAEQNIDSVSDALQRSLNRLRQSSIDEELFDVVAGFNALV